MKTRFEDGSFFIIQCNNASSFGAKFTEQLVFIREYFEGKKILYLENHSFKCTFISAHLEFHQSVVTTKTMDKIVAPQKLI